MNFTASAWKPLTAITILFVFISPFSSAADEKPLQVGFLVLDRVYNSELMAPYDIFHHTVFHTKPGMQVFTISAGPKEITTFEGLHLKTHYGLEDTPPIDVLVIPSAEQNMDQDLKNTTVRDWIHAKAQSAKYVVTLCDGAFLLANTGLLNGKRATTFPSDVEAFKKLFPKVNTLEGYSFVHDGKFLTSQGGAKSYDVAMYLVDLLYGEKVAAGVGRGLVIRWKDPDLVFFRAEP